MSVRLCSATRTEKGEWFHKLTKERHYFKGLSVYVDIVLIYRVPTRSYHTLVTYLYDTKWPWNCPIAKPDNLTITFWFHYRSVSKLNCLKWVITLNRNFRWHPDKAANLTIFRMEFKYLRRITLVIKYCIWAAILLLALWIAIEVNLFLRSE